MFEIAKIINEFDENVNTLFPSKTKEEVFIISSHKIPVYINEFWTAKQRQGNSLHEISYRACFKPQLPHFFIEKFTKENDIVYDPFTGRGTTIIEAALLGRNVISNDINPLSKILCQSRLYIPNIKDLKNRLDKIIIDKNLKTDLELSVFFHPETLSEILSFKNYFIQRENEKTFDNLDFWIQMLITNRLTGHSKGFLSVYTLPPNQAVTIDRQKKINLQRNQVAEYRNTKEIVLNKSKQLLKDIDLKDKYNLEKANKNAIFLSKDARETTEIKENSVQLTVTSPPFLDVIKYDDDNWLRCWFNNIDAKEIGKKITMSKKLDDWNNVMNDVFKELYRITKYDGYIAFEVGEVRNGKIKLEEEVVKLGIENGFNCLGILINEQIFTKTSNIWGVKNNDKGTNTNRIVIFKK